MVHTGLETARGPDEEGPRPGGTGRPARLPGTRMTNPLFSRGVAVFLQFHFGLSVTSKRVSRSQVLLAIRS